MSARASATPTRSWASPALRNGGSLIPYEAEALMELPHHLLLLVHVPSLGTASRKSGGLVEYPLGTSVGEARRSPGCGAGPGRRVCDDVSSPVHCSGTSFTNPPQLVACMAARVCTCAPKDQVTLAPGLSRREVLPSARAAAQCAATAALLTTNLTLILTDPPPDKSAIRDSSAGVAAWPLASGTSPRACSTNPAAPSSSFGGGTAITTPIPPVAQAPETARATACGSSTRADTGNPLRAVKKAGHSSHW